MKLPETLDALLQAMVQFDTVNAAVSGNLLAEAELAAYLAEVGAAWGLTVQRLPVEDRPANVLLTCPAKGPDASAQSWLLFDSHMDTVSAEGMSIDPFGGEIIDGRLFGRGACDTKGTGAAMLWALREYAALADRPNNIALLFSVDEEVGMTGIRSFIANDLPRLGMRFAGAIVGEPTLLRPIIAHNGVVRWTITTTGRASHAAIPELGRSAITMMRKVMDAVHARYIDRLDATHPLTGQAMCSITTIRGGSQINIIPESCCITIDHRFIPGQTLEGCVAAVQAILDDLMESDPTLKARIEDVHGAPALDPAVSADYLPTVRQALARHGCDVPPVGAPFATHAGDLALAGVPAIVLGPGDPTPMHTHKEWVALDEIHRGAAVYLDLMGEPMARKPH